MLTADPDNPRLPAAMKPQLTLASAARKIALPQDDLLLDSQGKAHLTHLAGSRILHLRWAGSWV
jgi:hypothetical protein